MMIAHLSRGLRKRVTTWDKPSQLALASGIVLLPIMLILGFWGPEPIQIPARIGGFGLLLTIQLVFLWGNRRDLSPYHNAQQHFINGDYETARDVLESIPFDDKPSVDALVLLANTYRRLGQVEESYATASRALEYQPDYHYALYSMGKILLSMGQYEDASNFITKALSSGAPDMVQFDLGQAYFLLGDYKQSHHHFSIALPMIDDEPSQRMLAQYYLYQMQARHQPLPELIRDNLDVWQDDAKTFRDTPYGIALQSDIDNLTTWLKES